MEKKLDGNYSRMLRTIFKKSPGGSTPQSSNSMATYDPLRKPSKLGEPDMRDTAGEVGTNSLVTYSFGPLNTD